MPEKKKDALEKADEFLLQLTPQIVKSYINKDATMQETTMFLNLCAKFKLDPFKREIYLIKYGSTPATYVVGYEVYLKRADRSGKWAGMESGTTGSLESKDLKAWVKIHRKDWSLPLYHEVEYDEYVQKRYDNQQQRKVPTKFWAGKPKTMLKKVAISQGMRMAFPDELGGMPYTSEEMPVEHDQMPKGDIIVEGKAVEEPPKEAEAIVEGTLIELTDEVIEEVEKTEDPTPTSPGETATKTVENEEEEQPLVLEPDLPGEGEVDAELIAMRNAIAQKIELLISHFGRNKKAMLAKIHTRIKEAFDTTRRTIPDDLNHQEAHFILELLDRSITHDENQLKLDEKEGEDNEPVRSDTQED